MDPLDLSDYEWQVTVRRLKIEDYDNLIALQAQCFPGIPTWGREQIESQLAIFPEGQLAVEIDGKLSGIVQQFDFGV